MGTCTEGPQVAARLPLLALLAAATVHVRAQLLDVVELLVDLLQLPHRARPAGLQCWACGCESAGAMTRYSVAAAAQPSSRTSAATAATLRRPASVGRPWMPPLGGWPPSLGTGARSPRRRRRAKRAPPATPAELVCLQALDRVDMSSRTVRSTALEGTVFCLAKPAPSGTLGERFGAEQARHTGRGAQPKLRGAERSTEDRSRKQLRLRLRSAPAGVAEDVGEPAPSRHAGDDLCGGSMKRFHIIRCVPGHKQHLRVQPRPSAPARREGDSWRVALLAWHRARWPPGPPPGASSPQHTSSLQAVAGRTITHRGSESASGPTCLPAWHDSGSSTG